DERDVLAVGVETDEAVGDEARDLDRVPVAVADERERRGIGIERELHLVPVMRRRRRAGACRRDEEEYGTVPCGLSHFLGTSTSAALPAASVARRDFPSVGPSSAAAMRNASRGPSHTPSLGRGAKRARPPSTTSSFATDETASFTTTSR